MSEPVFRDAPAAATSGYLDCLTSEQDAALKTMKEEITTLNLEWTDDYELLRFLRARKFDVTKAKDMFVAYKKWYADNNISQYPATYPPDVEVLAELIPHAYHGVDREGHPIYIERTGMIDCPTLMAQLSDNQIVVAHIFGQEKQIQRCREIAAERNLPEGSLERFTTIMDLKGLHMGHRAAVKFAELVTKNDEQYYPERMGYTLIVNPPFIFNFFYNIMKLMIDPATKAKVIVCKDHATLHKYVDPSQLPTIYGGVTDMPCLADPDVPALRAKYLTDEKYKDKYTTLTIPAGKSHAEVVNCKSGYSYHYCFRSNEDVKFGIRFFPEGVAHTDLDKSLVVNNEGVMSCAWPNMGVFNADHAGTMVLNWHNVNWWGEKKIDWTVVEEEQAVKISADSVAEAQEAMATMTIEEKASDDKEATA